MGFFTKLKKIWKTEDSPEGAAQATQDATSNAGPKAEDLWVTADDFDAATTASVGATSEEAPAKPVVAKPEPAASPAGETVPAAVASPESATPPAAEEPQPLAAAPRTDAALGSAEVPPTPDQTDTPPPGTPLATTPATDTNAGVEPSPGMEPAFDAPLEAPQDTPPSSGITVSTGALEKKPLEPQAPQTDTKPAVAAAEQAPAAPQERVAAAAMPQATPTAGEPTAPAPAPQAPLKTAPLETSQPVAPVQATGEPSDTPGAQATPPWRTDLILTLRKAEPRLSVWLDILLEGVEVAGPELWERLHFLFKSLEAPKREAEDFVSRFADWVTMMEYDEVELFRSELQYRLALALDLEDEEDERNRLFLKLSQGLSKTKEQIVKRIDGLLGSHSVIDEAFWEELEEILLMADVGFEPSAKLLESLRSKVRKRNTTDPAVFKDILREELAEIFRTPKTIKAINPPEVVMMIGVNGVGKTTTIAKLAHRDIMRGKKVLIAAGDTFRAAAIEQLEIWAKRVGAAFYAKSEGSDPAAVAFEAMDKCLAENFDVIYLDTAGRLHTKTNLMEELRKIRRVVNKKHAGAPHRSVLVLDATTGQNALSQTKLFNEAAGVDEIILTKLDGTAKGGVVVGIALSFGVPITYVGLGEKMEDLRPFDGQDFAQALLGVSS